MTDDRQPGEPAVGLLVTAALVVDENVHIEYSAEDGTLVLDLRGMWCAGRLTLTEAGADRLLHALTSATHDLKRKASAKVVSIRRNTVGGPEHLVGGRWGNNP